MLYMRWRIPIGAVLVQAALSSGRLCLAAGQGRESARTGLWATPPTCLWGRCQEAREKNLGKSGCGRDLKAGNCNTRESHFALGFLAGSGAHSEGQFDPPPLSCLFLSVALLPCFALPRHSRKPAFLCGVPLLPDRATTATTLFHVLPLLVKKATLPPRITEFSAESLN